MTAPGTRTDAPRHRLRRAAAAAGRLGLTLAVAGLSAAAVAGGATVLSQRAAAVPPPPAAAPVPVGVLHVRREPGYAAPRRFVGRIEPAAAADLAFELPGTLAAVLVAEGQRLAAGDIVARLDTRALEADRRGLLAERAALAAQAELLRLTEDRRRALEARGFTATQALDEARLTLAQVEAQMAAVAARIDAVDVALDKAVLRAPFAGTVGRRDLDRGATVAAGQPVVRLLSDAAPELAVGLPPALAAAVGPGAAVAVETEGVTLPARLARLRPDLDPATRTRTAIVALAPGAAPAFGQTALVLLAEEVADPGFWLPVRALREGPRGSWLVTVVAEGAAGPEARHEAVEILHAEGERVFLRGPLGDGTAVIADGAHRVTAGQPVAPRPEG